jgi:cell division septation protein DedD
MEIDNQNREIYHIVDHLPKANDDVKVIPAPEMPKILKETASEIPDNMDNWVETISEESATSNTNNSKNWELKENIKLAQKELSPIKTNSNEKIIIPEKIKDIEVKLQKSINSHATKTEETSQKTAEPVIEKAPQTQAPAVKGTWYTQLIASSSKKAVDNLWNQLSAKHSFLKSYTHEIEEITASTGSKLYRLKVGAFKTRKEAEELSEKLKKNQISCIIKQN